MRLHVSDLVLLLSASEDLKDRFAIQAGSDERFHIEFDVNVVFFFSANEHAKGRFLNRLQAWRIQIVRCGSHFSFSAW